MFSIHDVLTGCSFYNKNDGNVDSTKIMAKFEPQNHILGSQHVTNEATTPSMNVEGHFRARVVHTDAVD